VGKGKAHGPVVSGEVQDNGHMASGEGSLHTPARTERDFHFLFFPDIYGFFNYADMWGQFH
jgi:hypothetical protein